MKILGLILFCLFLTFVIVSGRGEMIETNGYAGLRWLDNEQLVFSTWNHRGIFIADIQHGSMTQIGDEFSRGRYLSISADSKTVLFKKMVVNDNHLLQQSAIYDILQRQTITLHSPAPRIGVPSQSSTGTIVYSKGDSILIQRNNKHLTNVDINCYSNLTPISPDGRYLLYNDNHDQIFLLEINTRLTRQLTDSEHSYFNPQWLEDGSRILIQASGEGIYLYDLSNSQLVKIGEGRNPRWVEDDGIIFTRTETFNYKIINSDLYFYRISSGHIYSVTNTPHFHEGEVSISPDLTKVAFINQADGAVWLGDLSWPGDIPTISNTREYLAADVVESPEYPALLSTSPMVMVSAPYIHQCWDTPDWFDGSWSCGPTSCMMAVQKYDELPSHPITCSWPYSHTSNFGWYIPNEYSYNGYTYNVMGLSPGDVWVPGAHGFICRELGAAYWDYMVAFMNQHTLTSSWGGTAWSTLCSQVDAGYPMVASATTLGYGHIQFFKGYLSSHIIIANDPYGNANTSPWGQYNGETSYYDWPGYDNGYVELGVNQLFYAQGSGGGGGDPTEADTIVDDLSDGFEKFGPIAYWHEWTGGYESHVWWTYSTAAPSDTNYVTWTPNLPRAGYWETYAFIPNNYATTNARYKIFHNAGMNTSVVNQTVYYNAWVSLGTYIFNKEDGGYIYLGDASDASGRWLGVDATKWCWRPHGCDTLVDDLTTGFHYYGYMEYWWDWAGGWDHHIFYTYSTMASFDTNYATWTPNLPVNGYYEVYVFIPSNNAVANSPYHIYYLRGDQTIWVNQAIYTNAWVSLGTFPFETSGGYLRLGDGTGTPGHRMGFDAAKWSYRFDLGVDDHQKTIDNFSINCYPNPFNEMVTIEIEGDRTHPEALLNLDIYDITGTRVRSMSLSGSRSTQPVKIIWDGLNQENEEVPSGLYFVQMKVGTSNIVKKIALIK